MSLRIRTADLWKCNNNSEPSAVSYQEEKGLYSPFPVIVVDNVLTLNKLITKIWNFFLIANS